MGDDSKPKTIRELQKEIPSSSDVGQRLAMAQDADDYEAAALSANLLEYMLMQAITTKFIRIGNDDLRSIFSDAGNGPLSTFSAKIKLAYALGIISADTRLHIERIREIRNHFAHHKDKVSFHHPSVIEVCTFFKQPKYFTDEQKKLRSTGLTQKCMYVHTCFFVSLELHKYIRSIGSDLTIALPIDCF